VGQMRLFSSLIKRFARDERGVFAVIFGLIAIVLVAVGGAVVDYVLLEQARNRAQIALDAAALALQPMVFENPIDIADIEGRAEALLLDQLGTEFGVGGELVNAVADVTQGSLTLNAHISMPTMFVSLVGVPQLSAGVTAQAQRMMLNLEVAMVLDNSGSMGERHGRTTRMDNLKTAARCATNILLYDAVDDATCQPRSGAAVKENVKIGLVPFTLMVNIGTQFRNASWLDWAGTSPLASLNNDNDDNEDTPFTGPVSRANLFAQTNTSWAGCVEARQAPYDTTDDPPDIPARKFLPLFSPDTYAGLSNSYLNDHGGSCPTKTCTERVERSNCTAERRGVTCSGATTTSYTRQEGDVTTNLRAASCVPSDATRIGNASSYWSGSNYITTTTYSLLSRRELQERLCKYNGQRAANSETNSNCPATTLLPLTSSPTAVTTRINQMTASGNTNIQQGAIWGVHMLTNGEPLTDALPRSDSVAKAMILMSDGENMPITRNDMNGSTYFSWGFQANGRLGPQNQTNTLSKMTAVMDDKTEAACQTAKDLGITVYVVGLAVPASVKSMLETCSSGTDYAYFPDTPSELIDDFKAIAGRLAPLRLSR
jgi:hypothetical protein